MNTKKFAARGTLLPLFQELGERFKGRTYQDIAEETGLGNWQVGRMLSLAIASPTYLDMSRMILASGLTPNQAARRAGLLVDDGAPLDALDLTETEREVVLALRQPELTEDMRREVARGAVEQADAKVTIIRGDEATREAERVLSTRRAG